MGGLLCSIEEENFWSGVVFISRTVGRGLLTEEFARLNFYYIGDGDWFGSIASCTISLDLRLFGESRTEECGIDITWTCCCMYTFLFHRYLLNIPSSEMHSIHYSLPSLLSLFYFSPDISKTCVIPPPS